MAKDKKESIPLCVRLDKELHNRLNKYCEQTGLKKTTAVEKALDEYFMKHFPIR